MRGERAGPSAARRGPDDAARGFHHGLGRPLGRCQPSSHDREESSDAFAFVIDQVVAARDIRFESFARTVGERADAAVGVENARSVDADPRQQARGFAQEVFDLPVLRGRGSRVAGETHVGGAQNVVIEPRDHEDVAAVRVGVGDDGMPRSTALQVEDEMRAFGGAEPGAKWLARGLAHGVDPGAGGVDDHVRVGVVAAAVDHVVIVDPAGGSVVDEDEIDGAVVAGVRSRFAGLGDVLDAEPLGDQDLRVVVEVSGRERLRAESGLEALQLAPRESAVAGGNLAGRDQIVEVEAAAHVRRGTRVALVDGKEERDRTHEMGAPAEQLLPRLQRLVNQAGVAGL